MGSLRTAVKGRPWIRNLAFFGQNMVMGIASMFSPPDRNSGSGHRYFLSAMVRVKNEERFLPEWIAHYLGLGVEHFYVYDNNSDDNTRGIIQPFIRSGLVTLISWPLVPVSPSCYVDFFSQYGRESRWVAFFDADEFLVEGASGLTRAVLEANANRPAIGVNWRYFGSSGHETVPNGLITREFDRADTGPNSHVKVIAQPSMIYKYRNSHGFYYRLGRLAATPGGRRVFGSFVSIDRDSALVLNHYVYRSREDYARKTALGFADARGMKDQGRRASRVDYEFPRHNETLVPMSVRVLDGTAETLREFGFPASLYQSDRS